MIEREMFVKKKAILDALHAEYPGTEVLNLKSSKRKEPPEGFAILEVSQRTPQGDKPWLPYQVALARYGIENITLRRVLPDELSLDCDSCLPSDLKDTLREAGIGFEHWATNLHEPEMHSHIRFRAPKLKQFKPHERRALKEAIIRLFVDRNGHIPDLCTAQPCRMISVGWSKHHKRDEYLQLVERHEGKPLILSEEWIFSVLQEARKTAAIRDESAIMPVVRAKWTCPVIKGTIKTGRKDDGVHRFCLILAAWANNKGMTESQAIDFVREWDKKNFKHEPPAQIPNQVRFAYKQGLTHISCSWMRRQGFCTRKDCGDEKDNRVAFMDIRRALDVIEDHSLQHDTMSQYIFDEGRILRDVPFCMGELNGYVYFGQLLPKIVNVNDSKGNVIGKTQKMMPVLISGNRRLYECSRELERHGIRIQETPHKLPFICGLDVLRGWLSGEQFDVSGEDLFKKVRGAYSRFCFFIDEDWYDVHALWDIGTYFAQFFYVFPLFELRGIPGTAKTKTMKVSRLLSLNPSDIMVNPSAPSLFRETHAKRWTKYIDEAENLYFFNSKTRRYEADERAELINGSYCRGSVVPRVEKIGSKFVTVYYEVFSPTMLASVNGLRGATETRAITHILTKASDSDPRGEIEVEDAEQESQWKDIHGQLFIFACENYHELVSIYKQMGTVDGIKKRDFQLWRPLLSVAKLISDDLYERVLAFGSKISTRRREDTLHESSIEAKLIAIVWKFVMNGDEKVYVKDIVGTYKLDHDDEHFTPGFNRIVSARLDALGFRDVRGKDRDGAFFEISEPLFQSIVLPLIPSFFSSQSSQSSHESSTDSENIQKKCDEVVTKCDELKNENVTNVTNVTKMTHINQTATISSKLQKWRNSHENSKNSCHTDFLKNVYKFTDEEIQKLKKEGQIHESTPGRFCLT